MVGRGTWLPQLPQEVQPLTNFLHQLCCVKCPDEVPAEVPPQKLKAAHLLHFQTLDKQQVKRVPLLPNVHYHRLCLVWVEGDVVVLTPCHQRGHLPPVSGLVPASDECYHGGVVSKLQEDVVLMTGHTVVGEQGVEDGTEDAALRCANV